MSLRISNGNILRHGLPSERLRTITKSLKEGSQPDGSFTKTANKQNRKDARNREDLSGHYSARGFQVPSIDEVRHLDYRRAFSLLPGVKVYGQT